MDIQGYFTKKGLLLAAKLAAGSTLKITRVCAGAAETALSASALSQIRQTLSVGTARRSGDTAVLPVTLEAGMAGTAYTLRELGVYAQDPEEGEILYKVYRLSEPVEIKPSSRLVLRFYLEETVSQDLNVTVVRASAGLLTEADMDVVFSTRVDVEERTLAASELPAYIKRLPKLLARYHVLHVSGTLNESLTLSGFYGSGGFRIVADTPGGCVFQKPVAVSGCSVNEVQFWNMSFQQTEALGGTDAMLTASASRYVRVTGSEFVGLGQESGRGAHADDSACLLLEGCKIHGFSQALFVGRCAKALVTGADVDFYDNTTGVYAWMGGEAYLYAPSLLGGSTNLKQGGVIVNANGTLL